METYATYCPEDNKLRLYVGRVPREEYLRLRAEGWTALHKQREAGGGDFAAVWTPERRDTALAYSPDGILDEDMSPEERAADRAERFGGYRDKRMGEAVDHADRFDSGPSAHGYQSQARAERAAARHDRIADRAGDAWDKAEYWQRRTAGVIAHALHVSSPSVRMGRIKELESEIRKAEKRRDEYAKRRELWFSVAAMTDADKQTAAAVKIAGAVQDYCHDYKHPRPEEIKNPHILDHGSSLYGLLTLSESCGKPITGAEAAALFLARNPELSAECPWLTHYRHRLAYETQMLEAQGGRAGELEIVAGGWLIYHRRRHSAPQALQIQKVNKSPTSGRVVSVAVWLPGDRWGNSSEGRHLRNIEIERASPETYRAPTPEELEKFEAETKAAKKAAKAAKPPAPPLINPTDADAERLQAALNERARARFLEHNPHYKNNPEYFQPSTVIRTTQAVYSARSAGTYARAFVSGFCGGCEESVRPGVYVGGSARARAERIGPELCKVRMTYGNGNTTNKADSVIVLTDKPQKPLPASVWLPYVAPIEAKPEAVTA